MLVLDLLALQRGQPAQLHVEDRVGLDLAQVELRDQSFARFVDARRVADQRDHGVEVVQRDEQTFQHVRTLLGLAEAVLRPVGDDLDLVVDVVPEDLLDVQHARL